MKKLLLFIIVFLGMFPTIHHAKLKIFNIVQVKAGGFADEDGDGSDDCNDDPSAPGCDTPPPCDDYGETYTETPYGSDNCNSYIYWDDISWDCSGSYEEDGIYANPLTSLTGVGLGLSEESGDFGDYITLTADANTTGSPGLTYKFEQFDPNDGWTTIGTPGTNNQTVYQIDQYGETDFRVTVTSSCAAVEVQDVNDFSTSNDLTGVTVTLDKSIVKPTDNVGITAAFSGPSAATNIKYTYDVLYHGNYVPLDMGDNNTAATFTYNMIMLGKVTFEVEVTYTIGGQTMSAQSTAVSVTSQYCADDFSAACGSLGSYFDNYWNLTLNRTFAAGATGKYEDGFMWELNTGAINDVSFDNSQTCDSPENLSSTTSYTDLNADPRTGGHFTIGKFHTHPPLDNCSNNSRTPGPSSSIDLAYPTDYPMFVRDYFYNVIGGPWPAGYNNPTFDYQYGLTCTDY